MKKFRIFFTSFLCAAGILFINEQTYAPSSVNAAPITEGFADLAEQLSPAVVNIYTTSTVKSSPMDDFFGSQVPPGFDQLFREFFNQNGIPQEQFQQQRKVTSLGSGFVISKDGLVVTNNHVIDGADEVKVKFPDGKTYKAKVLGSDKKTDIAVLKIQHKAVFPYVNFGNSDAARVGDWVLAIGNPFGLGGSVSAGIVSARNRNINAGPYDDFIQTDAAINRGNSGGPLFDIKGEVIGVNSAILSPSGGSVGIGFAIPSNLVNNIVTQLAKSGKVERGWLGVMIQDVTDGIAESVGLKTKSGAMIADVTKDGPADKAGLMDGDIVLSFNEKTIADVKSLPRIVAETPVGTTAPITVWRKGAEKTFQVKVGELEGHDEELAVNNSDPLKLPKGVEVKEMGINITPLTPQLRRAFRISEEVPYGVVITQVDTAGDASVRGVRVGDVIMEIQQQKVTTPEEFKAVFAEVKKIGRNVVLLTINREGRTRFLALRFK
jgi:serine protease Do